jgi:hypothetical protein
MKYITILTIMVVLSLVGCAYTSVSPEKSEEVSYINLSELTSESGAVCEDNTTVETPQDVSEISKEESTSNVREVLTVKVTEGDLVSFPNLKATDPDGDKLTYTFSAPLNSKGEWQTKDGDAGEKTVTITASDGLHKINQDVRIIIQPSNKAPVMEALSDITAEEGETITLEPKVVDPEGKTVKITYSGFMSSSTKVLDYNSQGEHTVTIEATDGANRVTQVVKITVEDVNRPPEFVRII